MKPNRILVANIGSTSLKFRLFEMPSERVLARGGADRIGSDASAWKLQVGNEPATEGTATFRDYESAISFFENQLGGFGDLAAAGFKPVMTQHISGTQYMTEPVLKAMEDYTTLFPAHNPPYVAAVRSFNKLYPKLPCIGTFETAFYQRLPEENQLFPVPRAWREKHGIRRTGFHGASHSFVTGRLAELKGTNKLRIISCHLGGSSSIAAVKDGVAIDSSWGMTSQSGLPHNNRAGDFDAFALIYLIRDLGLGIDEVERVLAKESGLRGLSGLSSGDIRDLTAAAANGNADARLALDFFVAQIRKFIGQFLLELNGADAIAFTAGIGENQADLRQAVCANLDYCGLKLDLKANAALKGSEGCISTPDSKIEVWVVPTNEEVVIARNAWRLLNGSSN